MPQLSKPSQLVREELEPRPEEAAARRVGMEIERIGLWPDGHALRYRRDPASQRPGAEDLMRLLENSYGWEPTLSASGDRIGFKSPTGKVSLEPGSQLEFSPDPVADLIQLHSIVQDFEDKVNAVTQTWNMRWVGLGINPLDRVDQLDVIPSTRYAIMTDYLGRRGALATSMMRLTTSIQLNFDYCDEAEAIEMLRTALALAPLSYAMFGNSTIAEGKQTSLLSHRAQIWLETDAQRSGLMPDAFKPDFDLDAYATYVARNPLMFAENTKGEFVGAEGASLEDIAAGKLPGVVADEKNAVHAIREIFTEARLKMGYLEVRSIDGLPTFQRFAATAFWTGVIYCSRTRRRVLERLGSLSPESRLQLWKDACNQGLAAKFGDTDLRTIARDLTDHARNCLKDRKRGEEQLLQPLDEMLAEGLNPAQKIRSLWNGEWKQDLQALLNYASR